MDGNGDAPAFVLRAVSVAPGAERAYDEHEWHDAIVAVARGEIELEWLCGTSYSFKRGDLLCLAGLRLKALHNRGREPALLVAVSRR
jgi:quercetin dioxygenase-like cupin family protein